MSHVQFIVMHLPLLKDINKQSYRWKIMARFARVWELKSKDRGLPMRWTSFCSTDRFLHCESFSFLCYKLRHLISNRLLFHCSRMAWWRFWFQKKEWTNFKNKSLKEPFIQLRISIYMMPRRNLGPWIILSGYALHIAPRLRKCNRNL